MHNYLIVLIAAGILATFLSAFAMPASDGPSIGSESFGTDKIGTPVELFTLRNANGVEARICSYGGIIVSLKVPDRHGHFEDVVLGYDNLEGYLKASPYFGALVGRYGNRIAKAQFTLNGTTYKLAANNNGVNSIHGGVQGFDKKVWQARTSMSPKGPSLELTYLSPDGEEGFPGNLHVTAVYTLTADNALHLDYTATTDKDTVVNLTQHSYFNLAGKGNILEHEMTIPAAKITPIDAALIPTGELRPVKGTPFDFTQAHRIGERIDNDDEQLKLARGYDHNWIIDKPAGALGLAATVYEPTTGRVLEALTTEPGIQFYTGNFLNGITGKGGWAYTGRSALCLEPQHYPNSPNQPSFPSVVLKPGETYHNTIIYRFSTRP